MIFGGVAAKLLAGVAAVAVIFGAGFGLEWHLRNGDDALAQVARDAATAKVLKHETAVALQSGAAGQALADSAAGGFALQQRKQSAATQKLIADVAKHLPPPEAPSALSASPQGGGKETSDANVPVVVYGVPWGLVRLHDAAASGADPAGFSLGSGESDGAPASVDLSDLATVLVGNYGVCRANAEQLEAFQRWAVSVDAWYADLVKKLGPR